jgi:8-oxo-dGTP pyrophosphatase MutT (NUDIX family)
VDEGFERQLRDTLARPLPGLDAQMRLSPTPRVGWDPAVVPAGLRDAAGLILLYRMNREWCLPLTVRAASLRSHTGQVSLPGGRVDEGESVEAAALREACEEIGVAPASVRVLGRLTPLHIPVSRHMLYPVIGITERRPDFRPAEQEVARILEVPVATLIDPAIVHHETWMRTIEGASIEIDVPYFAIDGERVWGATGMVLAEFRAVLEALR